MSSVGVSFSGVVGLLWMGLGFYFVILHTLSRHYSAWNFQFKCKLYRTSQRT